MKWRAGTVAKELTIRKDTIMTEDWKIGFREAVADMLRTQGSFVSKNPFYGWQSDHVNTSHSTCKLKSIDTSTVQDKAVSQFAGTFTGARDIVILVAKATCQCGEYTNAEFGWEGTLGDALSFLLRD